MFLKLFNKYFGDIQPERSTTMSTFARITEDNRLFSPAGEFTGTYGRRRDAVRGATRRGWQVA